MFSSFSSPLITEIPSSPDATQKGVTAHVASLIMQGGDVRLAALPSEAMQRVCADCVVTKDAATGIDMRSCETCLCMFCNSIKCPAAVFSSISALSPIDASAEGDTYHVMLGCVRCALKGAVRGVPRGKSVAWAERVPQMVASTLGGRMHVGCAMSKSNCGGSSAEVLRCPTCREVVFPMSTSSTLAEAHGAAGEAQQADTTLPTPPTDRSVPSAAVGTKAVATEELGKKRMIDLFSGLMRIDPRVACFNDIHAGLLEWSNGVDPSVSGVDLRRKPRTLELFFQVGGALSLPPMRTRQCVADDIQQQEIILSRLVEQRCNSTRFARDGGRGLKRGREATAEGTVLSQLFSLSPEDAEDLGTVLGPSIVECLAGEEDLRRVRKQDEGIAKQKATLTRSQTRVSTGTLGESPFVLSRSKRLAEMQRRWEDVGVGFFEPESA